MKDSEQKNRGLLKSVSRSFYLSIRILPGGMRDSIALGYLLARFTDTLADDLRLNPSDRLRALDGFSQWVTGPRTDPPVSLVDQWSQMAESHEHKGEQILLGSPRVLHEWFHHRPYPEQKEIRDVLTTIVGGQSADIERFSGADFAFLSDAEELKNYTWQVAGCVGRFWTKIGFLSDPEFSIDVNESEMVMQGESYGCGLQLVNILRDMTSDRRLGRCYFPRDLFPRDMVNAWRAGRSGGDPRPYLQDWVTRCREGLFDGLRYGRALRRTRTRLASVLPALLGVRTLRRWEDATPEEVENGVKITRSEVKSIMRRVGVAAFSPAKLERLYRELE